MQLAGRFFGYHNLIREHARQTVERPAYIPSPRLKIGPAEILKSIPQTVWFGPKPRPPKMEVALNQEQINYDAKGAFALPEEFPQEGYLGENLYPF